MAIQIEETFQVAAPIEVVWKFMMEPRQVVTCLPGAELEEVIDDRTFRGAVKVKLGAINARYRGQVQLTEVDESAHVVSMLAEGREPGGGTARGTVTSTLSVLGDGRTEVVAEARIDLTGRVVQVGRGMIQGVSSQLFAQFATRIRENLEQSERPEREAGEVAVASANAGAESISLLPIVLRVLWQPIARFFRRLFGLSGQQDN